MWLTLISRFVFDPGQDAEGVPRCSRACRLNRPFHPAYPLTLSPCYPAGHIPLPEVHLDQR